MQDPHLAKIKQAMGYGGGRPIVQFYDHAVKDEALSEQCGRPRYKKLVYIQKQSSAPDQVVKDTFSRKATEQDKHDFPEEWAEYERRKGAIDNLDPLLTSVPGMHVAAQFELRDLGIFTCRQLVDYQKPLEGLEELRETAKRILHVSDDLLAGRKSNVVEIKPQPQIQNFHYEFTV